MKNNNNNNTIKLNPDFITGLTDAEGCFSIGKHKDNRARFKASIGLRFKITMLENETQLLCMVKDFFDCGFITYKDGSVDYIVRDINSIREIIIPHFSKYPLHGSKNLKLEKLFILRELILNKNHLFKVGRSRQWKSHVKLNVIKL